MTTVNYKDEAYSIIKEKIIRLELLPGEKISKKQFVAMLNIGDTPVRDAILELKREGLIEIKPQSGTSISKIGMQKVKEAKFVRQNLEAAIFSEAVDLISKSQIEELQQLLVIQELYLKNVDSDKFFQLDESFHKFFYLISNKMHVYHWLLDINVHLNRYRYLTLEVTELDWQEIVEQHKKILVALKNKDKVLISSLAFTHLNLVDDNFHAVLKEFPTYFSI